MSRWLFDSNTYISFFQGKKNVSLLCYHQNQLTCRAFNTLRNSRYYIVDAKELIIPHILIFHASQKVKTPFAWFLEILN